MLGLFQLIFSRQTRKREPPAAAKLMNLKAQGQTLPNDGMMSQGQSQAIGNVPSPPRRIMRITAHFQIKIPLQLQVSEIRTIESSMSLLKAFLNFKISQRLWNIL